MVLLPPNQDPTETCNSLHPSTQFEYWTCRNIFHNCCLPPMYIFLHWTQPRRLYRLFCRGTLQIFLPGMLGCLTCETPYDTMMKCLQHLHHCPRDQPNISPVHQNHLHHRILQCCPSLTVVTVLCITLYTTTHHLRTFTRF